MDKKEKDRIVMDQAQYEIDKNISAISAIINPKEHENIFKIVNKILK